MTGQLWGIPYRVLCINVRREAFGVIQHDRSGGSVDLSGILTAEEIDDVTSIL